ncbi:MAG: outer membrane beta-barrel protein, partial [Segetibacter sp.]|nr:outer membrane beta-barrel protein [Segetibacter sp.]
SRITASQNFKLPKDYTVEVTGFYQSPSLIGRTKQLGYGTLNFGAQKKLGAKKGSLRFTVTDIFHTLIIRFHDYIPDQYLNGRVRLEFVQRTFGLTYTRSFGNDKLKAKRNITGAEEERKRVE